MHSFTYQPWGNPTASGVFAIFFALWIGTTNLFLIVMFITNPKLLNSRQNIVLLHNAVADLTAGVFYCPLAAEYYFRGFWAHGCSSFFVWFTFALPVCFLATHSVLMMLVLRVVPLYGRGSRIRLSRTVVNLIFCMAFLLFWSYFIVIGIYLNSSRSTHVHIEIAPNVLCKGVVASDRSAVIDSLVYFLPASLCIVLLIAIAVKEKTTVAIPLTQLQLDSITDQNTGLSLRVLSAITVLTCLLPLPSFVATWMTVGGGDTCQSHSCLLWLRALIALADWLIISKSGIIPMVLLFAVGRHASFGFRRLSSSDGGRRHLMPGDGLGEDDDDDDDDGNNGGNDHYCNDDDDGGDHDAPFSTI